MRKRTIVLAGVLAILILAVLGWKLFERESSVTLDMGCDSPDCLDRKMEGLAPDGEKLREDVGQSKEVAVGAENGTEENPVSLDQEKAEIGQEAEREKDQKEPEPEAKVDFKIRSNLVSWGHEKASGRKIDTIILHSTYNATGGNEFDLDKIIGIYKSYGVAPHYIVARDAKVYQTVEDKNITYHAGESKMPDGRTGVNNFSIGIEIINSKTQGPTSAQYASLKSLISYLKGKYSIKYTLGHSDIAPGRKDDPWKFEWGKVK